MRRLIGAVAAVALSIGQVTAQAATLDFENLNPAPAAFDLMPAQYAGFTFNGWYFGPDTLYTPASGSIDLFTDYADPANPADYVITNSNNQIERAAGFVFDGASFSGYSGVTFELWRNGALVHTSASLPDAPSTTPYGPTFLSSGYTGPVDKVVVSGVQGYYAMDDFSFSAVSSVPEPASNALILLGLGLVIAGRRQYFDQRIAK